jgi:L-asparaginase / beta-aspartyl-peptidase
MEKTKHHYLVGQAAEKLAVQESLEIVHKSYFSTEKRKEQLLLAKKVGSIVNDHDFESRKSSSGSPTPTSTVVHDSVAVDVDTLHAGNDVTDLGGDVEGKFPGSTGTVGCVCMYRGHVAAATSTGGLTNKMAGRIGEQDIPKRISFVI